MSDLHEPITISAESARRVYIGLFGAEPDEVDENLQFEDERHAWAYSPYVELPARSDNNIIIHLVDKDDPDSAAEVVAQVLDRNSKCKLLKFECDSASVVADAVMNLRAQINTVR